VTADCPASCNTVYKAVCYCLILLTDQQLPFKRAIVTAGVSINEQLSFDSYPLFSGNDSVLIPGNLGMRKARNPGHPGNWSPGMKPLVTVQTSSAIRELLLIQQNK